ncbi:ComF family protein [Streptomyces sp. NPDC001020]
MRGWWQDLTDLVLPAECGGCGRPRTVLCAECRAALHGRVPRRVRPTPEPAGLPVVHAAAPYEGAVRALILAHKERGALPLAGPLGTALAGAVRAGLEVAVTRWSTEGSGAEPFDGRAAARRAGSCSAVTWPHGDRAPVLLVPVPSARRSVRARGHDPARRIALAAAGELRRTGTTARVVAVLRQRRTVADQSELSSRQRLANLAGALEVAGGAAGLLTGGRIVLVDDLMTTGASLTEAARAVREALDLIDTEEAEVYPSAAGEARGKWNAMGTTAPARRHRTPYGMAIGDGVGDGIHAAVIATSQDSFENNRN